MGFNLFFMDDIYKITVLNCRRVCYS
jgi:hypothetical protein